MDGRVRAVSSVGPPAQPPSGGLTVCEERPSNLPLAVSCAFTDSGLTNLTAFARFESRSHTAIVASTSFATMQCEAEASDEQSDLKLPRQSREDNEHAVAASESSTRDQIFVRG